MNIEDFIVQILELWEANQTKYRRYREKQPSESFIYKTQGTGTNMFSSSIQTLFKIGLKRLIIYWGVKPKNDPYLPSPLAAHLHQNKKSEE